MKTGSCLCGGVTYTHTKALRGSVACHCVQCRKTSGHYVSAIRVGADDLTITNDATLTWFQSSPSAQRGFCKACGSSLFWNDAVTPDRVSVMSGTIDGATGITTEKHIFVADKGDYYTIADDAPHFEQS